MSASQGLPALSTLLPGSLQPRVISPERWQSLRALHSEIKHARHQLAQLQRQRLKELDTHCQQARDTAHQQGLADASKELLDVSTALRRAATEQQSELLQLMFAAMEQMLGSVPPSLVTEQLAKAALTKQIEQHTAFTVLVHPQTQQAVSTALDKWCEREQALRIDVQADPALATTDCDIETAHGTVRAGLASQIETLKRALLGACEREQRREPLANGSRHETAECHE